MPQNFSTTKNSFNILALAGRFLGVEMGRAEECSKTGLSVFLWNQFSILLTLNPSADMRRIEVEKYGKLEV